MATKSVLGGDYSLDERTDDDLVDLARSGGSRTGAWDELYRRHAASARSVARHIMGSREDADDVVNDAFAGMIAAIGRGAGPRTNFRQYLMACVRNGCKSRAWRSSTSVSTDPDMLEQRHGVIFEDAERFGEAGLVASAFSSLSTDWQRALWLTAVEERPTEYVARELGRRPAAVAALAHRAREAFAEAYLSQHQRQASAPSCERIYPKLAHYVRGRAGDIDTNRVEHHLSRCADCSRTVVELRDVNSSLRSLVLPTSLIATGTLTAGVAPVVGIGAAAGFAGWTASVFGGAVLAKVAVIAALVVPAAVLATDSERPQRTIRNTAVADDSGVAAVDIRSDFNFRIPLGSGKAAAPDDSQPVTTASVGDASPEASLPSIDRPALTTAPTGAVIVAGSAAVKGAGQAASQPPPTSVTTPPIDSPASSVSSTKIPASPNPPISTSEINTPVISTPVVSTPVIGTPVVTTPEIVTPAIVTPIVGIPSIVVPSLTVPALAAPSAVVPSITVPSIAVRPPIAMPVVSIPQVVVVPLTVAEPPLPLPELSLTGLLGL